MKAREFLPVSDFIRFNAAKPCRMKCGACKQPWGKTGTESVFVAWAELKQVYLCEGCATNFQEIKSKVDEYYGNKTETETETEETKM